MVNAENAENGGCLQRNSTECEEYAGAQSAVQPETGETGVREPKLLERILFDIVNNSSNSLFNRGHVITKGTQYPSTLYISNGGNAKTGIIIDLGQVFELEKIVVWHYWSGGRTYMGTQTEVSIDKENWETVFDSATEGTYAETEGGHEINFNTMNASITKSGIYKTTELYEI